MRKLFGTALLAVTLFAPAALPAHKEAQPITDNLISDQVHMKLANDPDVKGGALEVEVKNGVVTLKGSVEREKWKEKATKLTRKVKGVKEVNNQLTVSSVRTAPHP